MYKPLTTPLKITALSQFPNLYNTTSTIELSGSMLGWFLVLFLECCHFRQGDFVRYLTGEVVLGRQGHDPALSSSTPGISHSCTARADPHPDHHRALLPPDTLLGQLRAALQEAPKPLVTSTVPMVPVGPFQPRIS